MYCYWKEFTACFVCLYPPPPPHKNFPELRLTDTEIKQISVLGICWNESSFIDQPVTLFYLLLCAVIPQFRQHNSSLTDTGTYQHNHMG